MPLAGDGVEAVQLTDGVGQIEQAIGNGGRRERALDRRRVPDFLAGGGLDASLITRLRRETPVRAFHVGRSVRQGQCANVELVRELVNSDSR